MDRVKASPAYASKLIAEFNAKTSRFGEPEDLLVIKRMREGGLNDEQIAMVCIAFASACDTCRDADTDCYCDPAYDI